jgi:hypothetical protein
MSVWLEDSSKAAELSTKTIADLEKGQNSTLSVSIWNAVMAQNKNGIKVDSVETEAPEAPESKYDSKEERVGGVNGNGNGDASNGGAVEEDDGNVGAIIATVVGVVAALAIGGVWFMWVQKKKKNTGKSPGGMGNDFAIGVLESGTGTGVATTQMTEIRGKRVSMANPLNMGAASQENELGLSPAMKKQGWASAVDDEGDMYYYNHKQGVSTYDVPVYKNGSWVALSEDEDEEEDDDEDDGGMENGGTGRLAAQTSKKKPSLLVHNTRKMATTNKNVKAKKSMSMAVVRKKKHSSLGGGETDKNRINKRSQSLAVNTSKSNAPDSRWERKKKLLSQPAIPIVNEEVEEEEEALVLTAAMKKSGWKTATDDDGDEYFYNHTRGESTYELPVLKDGAFVAPSDDETDDESD